MSDTHISPDAVGSFGGLFPSTQWTLWLDPLMKLGPVADEALERLCRAYWTPLYEFIRRRGFDHHQSEDLTQEFIAAMVQRSAFAEVKRNDGRFRTYLATCLRHFLTSHLVAEFEGNANTVSASSAAEDGEMYAFAFAAGAPDQEFDRSWALSTVNAVLSDLQGEYDGLGKPELFVALREYLPGGTAQKAQKEWAAELGISPERFNLLLHRLRARFAERLRDVVGHTVSEPGEIDAELRHLISSMLAA